MSRQGSNGRVRRGAVLVLLLVSCATAKPGVRSDSDRSDPAGVSDGRPAKGGTGTLAGETPPETPTPAPPPKPLRPLEPPEVRFLTDSDRLEPEARVALDQFAERWLERAQGPRLLVEGHADERGTEEYNLILGDRRANAVRRYLSGLGVKAERIATISYGELRPALVQRDESGWSVNRRAVLRAEE